MRLIHLAVASVNTTVGAVRSNTERCIEMAHQMANDDVTLAVFPEQVIGGYCPEDLVQWRGFVRAQRQQLERFAKETNELDTAFALGLIVGVGGDLFNAAALVHHGRIVGFTAKEKLPTYNIFYESRALSRGIPYMHLDAEGVPLSDSVVRFDFGTVALEVCEDIWSRRTDAPSLLFGREIVCNLSASPFRAGVVGTRYG